MNKKMFETINKQINEELFSAYLYLSMSSYFGAQNLPGLAHWMNLQAQEEREHAMKFFKYLEDRGQQPILKSINAPETTWASPLKVFEEAYKHEQHITKAIYNLVDIAISVKDHATQSFLKWFIDEQVEEEATADGIVQKLKMVGNDKAGLLYLDDELAKRVVTANDAET